MRTGGWEPKTTEATTDAPFARYLPLPMDHHWTARVSLVVAVLLLLPSCGEVVGEQTMQRVATNDRPRATPAIEAPAPSTTATTVPTPLAVPLEDGHTAPTATTAPLGTDTVTAVVPSPEPAPPPTTSPPPPPPPPARNVPEQPWTPFATVGGITLVHPATRVERVGFHQSNHDGARQLDPLATAVSPVTLEGRSRETAARTAADVVVDPSAEIRSPVTGRVVRAGTYVLYCDYSDDYLVVEPDQHPGWEVKMLHIDGVRMQAGDRVVAGETVVAGRATQLPFESQVDEVGGFDPAWPHVHIEVIDLAIPDIPSPGGGCD